MNKVKIDKQVLSEGLYAGDYFVDERALETYMLDALAVVALKRMTGRMTGWGVAGRDLLSLAMKVL